MKKIHVLKWACRALLILIVGGGVLKLFPRPPIDFELIALVLLILRILAGGVWRIFSKSFSKYESGKSSIIEVLREVFHYIKKCFYWCIVVPLGIGFCLILIKTAARDVGSIPVFRLLFLTAIRIVIYSWLFKSKSVLFEIKKWWGRTYSHEIRRFIQIFFSFLIVLVLGLALCVVFIIIPISTGQDVGWSLSVAAVLTTFSLGSIFPQFPRKGLQPKKDQPWKPMVEVVWEVIRSSMEKNFFSFVQSVQNFLKISVTIFLGLVTFILKKLKNWLKNFGP